MTKLLYTFANDKNGGPTTLIEASDGNLYGATLGAVAGGGQSQFFTLTPSGQYTRLFLLSDAACYCGLVQGSDGLIYGTAVAGSTTGLGATFALDVGLPKPVPRPQHFQPQAGPVGARVLIWGYDLLSAAVQFNGVPAAAVSNSGSNYIWLAVPAGATTGPITITTPGGSVTTHASFTVH
jgi:hypothetical protein